MDHFFILRLLIIILALSFHEYAHAKVADASGDPTPRSQGRVTMNPLAHLDPMGTLMIFITSLSGFGIGWGKPVMVDPSRMRNPRWDHFWSVAAGPLSNLLQAAVFGIAFRVLAMAGILHTSTLLAQFLYFGVIINLSLCFFNLIPFGPLDGHWLVGAFLHDRARYNWYKFNAQVGGGILLGAILLGQFVPQLNIVGKVLSPIVMAFEKVILGI